MKSLINRVAAMLVLGALACAVSFAAAKEKKHSVTLPSNVTINGTQVKQGDYDLVFDEQSGELSLMKGKTLIAKVSARVEKLDKKAKSTEVRSNGSGDTAALVSITLGGSDQSFVVTGNSGSATGNN